MRLHRSELCVPGSNPSMLAKAPALGADVVMLDLEDAVAPAEKAAARAQVIAALREQDWRGASISVRVNALDTPYCYRDLIDVVEQTGSHVDVIVIPKVASAADVHVVATLLSQLEAATGLREGRLAITVLVETAAGMGNVDEIAAACPDRMEAMVFGCADYAASLQCHTTAIGGANPNYAVLTDPCDDERQLHWCDPWHHALASVAVACRANGLRPIDGPFGDVTDPDGYIMAARRAAALGFEGKWAIHPSQIELAHQVFTPAGSLVQRAREILVAMDSAAADGIGAASLDGRLIDAASRRQAEHLLDKVAQIAARADRSTAAGAHDR